MLNFTVLSLVTTSLISHSPAFVNNHFTISKCEFQLFSTLLFYNQQKLHLQSSSFKKGLGGILYIDNSIKQENDRKTYQNITFKEQLDMPNQEMSATIMECIFDQVHTNGLSTPHVIFVNAVDRSLYITDTTFIDCTSQKGILFLQSCRCLTMTHTCCFHSECDNGYSFFYCDCKDEDFFVFIYSTIVSSKVSSDQDKSSICNTFCKNGDQYYKCLNMTDCPYKGFEFDSPNCFAFAFNTIMNCDYRSFSLTGDYNNKPCYDKVVDRCNIIGSDNALAEAIYIESKNTFCVTFDECVIMSNDKGIISYNGENIKLVLQSCILSQGINDDNITKVNITINGNDKKYITLHPHYTNSYCPGVAVENKEPAVGCNADKCMDTLCNRTIGFPLGVIPYTTIHHKDIQIEEIPQTETPKPDQTKAQLPNQPEVPLPDQTEVPLPDQTEVVPDSTPIIPLPIPPDDDSSVQKEKDGTNWTKIGTAIGCTVAGVAIIAVIAFFLIKKFKRIPTISNQINETNNDASITYENELRNLDQDDPFVNDF